MEIREKYLSVDSVENGEIITILDEGEYSTIKDAKGIEKSVINFRVNNGRYDLIYTPSVVAQKLLIKAYGRDTKDWVMKKFSVKLVDSMAFGKPSKSILPQPLEVKI